MKEYMTMHNQMKPYLYILKDKIPVPVWDALEWDKWLRTADRQVAETYIGEIRISTVFLSLDHAFLGGPPILFETMIFNGDLDGYQWRYHTWEEAEQGHEDVVLLVKEYGKAEDQVNAVFNELQTDLLIRSITKIKREE